MSIHVTLGVARNIPGWIRTWINIPKLCKSHGGPLVYHTKQTSLVQCNLKDCIGFVLRCVFLLFVRSTYILRGGFTSTVTSVQMIHGLPWISSFGHSWGASPTIFIHGNPYIILYLYVIKWNAFYSNGNISREIAFYIILQVTTALLIAKQFPQRHLNKLVDILHLVLVMFTTIYYFFYSHRTV